MGLASFVLRLMPWCDLEAQFRVRGGRVPPKAGSRRHAVNDFLNTISVGQNLLRGSRMRS
jgi:hypothetical protein